MNTKTFACTIAAGAMLATPAAALAKHAHPVTPVKPHNAANCTKTHAVGFVVAGTLVSVTADNPATPASEATVALTVTGANRHARQSGDIADQDATKPGVQVRGAAFTVPAGDAFKLMLHGYQGTDTPSPGDRVVVTGRIARTSTRCAAAGTSTADRYGAIDVRRVAIADRDPDA
jgi:hypothetical protein